MIQTVNDEILKSFYKIDSGAELDYQRERFCDLLKGFENTFGDSKEGHELSIFSSPGRTEICGNHTDHQNGQVLAAAINLDTIAATRINNEGVIRIQSEGYPPIRIDLNDIDTPKEEEKGRTRALVKGVLKYLKNCGYSINEGFDAYIISDVDPGSGLSSSASFEVLIGTIISGIFFDGAISKILIAKAGQYAENVFFGKPCGLMDQMACSVGSLVYIDFKKKEDPFIEPVDFILSDYNFSLAITNTGGSHSDLTNEYADVTEEMRKIATALNTDTGTLLGLKIQDIYNNIARLRQEAGDRAVLRAIHFINENERVLKLVNAIKEKDINEALRLINESGNSSYKYLQNVYVASNPKSQNVALALAITDEWLSRNNLSGASRVHGGGFAGTIQAFISSDMADTYKELMDKIYGKDSCKILKIRQQGGERII